MEAIEKSGIQTHKELEQQGFSQELSECQSEICRLFHFVTALQKAGEAGSKWYVTIADRIEEGLIKCHTHTERAQHELYHHFLKDEQ